MENNIPNKFEQLFIDTSWNKGNDSKLSSMERSYLNELYLQFNKWSIQNKINPPSTEEQLPVVGFIKD